MTVMDATQCREVLSKLLAEEGGLLTVLEQQLLHEHQLLVDNDVEGLDAAGAKRQSCVGQLLRVEDERRALCRALAQPADVSGVERLIAWCDPEASLLAALRDCMDRAGRCREQNVRNGVLVNARLQRVSNMLGMLNVPGTGSPVYGKSGASTTPPRAGRLLSASA